MDMDIYGANCNSVLSKFSSKEYIEAWANTLTYSQMKARNVNSDPTSQDYFEKMIQVLGQIGWKVDELLKYYKPPYADRIKPVQILKDIVETIINKAIPSSVLPIYNLKGDIFKIIDALPDSPPQVQSFLDSWWGNRYVYIEYNHFSTGYLISLLGQCYFMAAFFSFKANINNWRFLYTEFNAKDIDPIIDSLGLTLDIAKYQEIKDDIINEMKQQEQDLINSTQIEI